MASQATKTQKWMYLDKQMEDGIPSLEYHGEIQQKG